MALAVVAFGRSIGSAEAVTFHDHASLVVVLRLFIYSRPVFSGRLRGSGALQGHGRARGAFGACLGEP